MAKTSPIGKAKTARKRVLFPVITLTGLAITTLLPPAQALEKVTETDPNTGKTFTADVESKTNPELGEHDVNGVVYEETDRLIVVYKDSNMTPSDKEETAKEALKDTEVEEGSTKLVKETTAGDQKSGVIELPETLDKEAQDKVIGEMEKDPNILSVEPDYIVKALSAITANTEPMASQQYNLTSSFINAEKAWANSTGKGTIIDIIDSGADMNHPDLKSNIIGGYDFISDEYYGRDGQSGRDSDPSDTGTYNGSVTSNWHGSHVAGIAAAARNNIGISGVAPEAKLRINRALGRAGSGYISDFADAVVASAGGKVSGVPQYSKKSSVINMSMAWPSTSCPAVIDSAIRFAHSKDVPVVVAAGNDGRPAAGYAPANCEGAIVVGATTSWNTLTSYSNYGGPVDVVAPGGTTGSPIWSSVNTGAYGPAKSSWGPLNGTSMAAPQVAGTVALMKEKNPSLKVEAIRNILQKSGKKIDGVTQPNAQLAVANTPSPEPVYPIVNGMRSFYDANGGKAKFGNPTDVERASVDGGVYQTFDSGITLYWTADAGVHSVWTKGGIGQKFREMGYERGIGYPVTEETVGEFGSVYQIFEKPTGGRTMLSWHQNLGTFAFSGNEYGWVMDPEARVTGIPASNKTPIAGGHYTKFKNMNTGKVKVAYYYKGVTVLDYPKVLVEGSGMDHAFWRDGGPVKMGWPMTNEVATPDGKAVVQTFEKPDGFTVNYYWTPQNGASFINAKGGLYWHWMNNGGTAKFGYPVTNEAANSKGEITVKFSGGATLVWKDGRITQR